MAGAFSAQFTCGYGGALTGTGAPFRYSSRISFPLWSRGVWHSTHMATSSTMYFPRLTKSVPSDEETEFSWRSAGDALDRRTKITKFRDIGETNFILDISSGKQQQCHV